MGNRDICLCSWQLNSYFISYRNHRLSAGLPAQGYHRDLIVSPMLHNPFFIEVSRPTGRYRTLELIPVYREQDGQYIATSNFRIYEGYTPDVEDGIDGDWLKEQYFDNIELMGDDNPCFLGELKFPGVAYFEWCYLGHQLNPTEVWQIVDLLQNCLRTYI